MNLTLRHALVWGIVTALVTTIATALLDFNPMAIVDWKVWGSGIAGAAVRSIAQAVLQAWATSRNK